MNRRRLLLSALFSLWFICAEASSTPRVVVSITPLHSLVAGVMEGVASPERLLPDGASPHTYAMRPSDMRKLNTADIVFWIGGGLETFLERPLHTLGEQTDRIALLDLQDLHRLPVRKGGRWTTHTHVTSDRHRGSAVDPHIWLDPTNAVVMVEHIVQTLSVHDSANAARYRANGATLKQRLATLDEEINQLLLPVHAEPYVVFHDAYQYFEVRYGLRPVGAITVDPSVMPGARRLREIRTAIMASQARCVFTEPQFRPALVETVIEGTKASSAVLDPLGSGIEAGPEAYFELMRGMAESVRGCLE